MFFKASGGAPSHATLWYAPALPANIRLALDILVMNTLAYLFRALTSSKFLELVSVYLNILHSGKLLPDP